MSTVTKSKPVKTPPLTMVHDRTLPFEKIKQCHSVTKQSFNSRLIHTGTLFLLLICGSSGLTIENVMTPTFRTFKFWRWFGLIDHYLENKELERVANVVKSMFDNPDIPPQDSQDIDEETGKQVTANLHQNLNHGVRAMIFAGLAYPPFAEFRENEIQGYRKIYGSPDDSEENGFRYCEDQVQVYENETEKVRYIVFRGTTNVIDQVKNADIFVRSEASQDDIEAIKELLEEPKSNLQDRNFLDDEGGTWKIRFTGHSRGATELLYLLKSLVDDGYTYDHACLFAIGTGVYFSDRARKTFEWGLRESKNLFFINRKDFVSLGIHYVLNTLLCENEDGDSDPVATTRLRNITRKNNLIFIDKYDDKEAEDKQKLDKTQHKLSSYFMHHNLVKDGIVWKLNPAKKFYESISQLDPVVDDLQFRKELSKSSLQVGGEFNEECKKKKTVDEEPEPTQVRVQCDKASFWNKIWAWLGFESVDLC